MNHENTNFEWCVWHLTGGKKKLVDRNSKDFLHLRRWLRMDVQKKWRFRIFSLLHLFRVFLGFQREPLVSIIGNWCWNSVPFSICLKMAGNWMWKPFSNCKIVTRQRQNMEWNTNDTSAMNHMMAYAHCLHIVYIHIPIHIFWGVQ